MFSFEIIVQQTEESRKSLVGQIILLCYVSVQLNFFLKFTDSSQQTSVLLSSDVRLIGPAAEASDWSPVARGRFGLAVVLPSGEVSRSSAADSPPDGPGAGVHSAPRS